MLMRMMMTATVLVVMPTVLQAQGWPNNEGPMHHVLITLDSGTQVLNVEAPALADPPELRCYVENYNTPADVLNDSCYNDQYGWLAGGFIELPAESAIWVELVDQSGGLDFYQGGMRPMTPMHTYDAILGTDGSSERWQWNGMMTHNWVRATTLGSKSATFNVYVGDLQGDPLPGYTGDQVTLDWATAENATPQLGGPMKHIFVTLEDDVVGISLQGDPTERLWMRDYNETYEAPASVLDGKGYNAQYGWLAGGFIALPPGGRIWVQLIDATDGLETYEALTFMPIFGTASGPILWQWGGTMVHNWYAATLCGKYEATYEVFVGDVNGQLLDGFTSAQVTLVWQFLPEDQRGDTDADGDVTLLDFAAFQTCFSPEVDMSMPRECGCVDFDGDEDVDLDDYRAFREVAG